MKYTTKIALIASLSIVLALSTSYVVIEKQATVAKTDAGFDYSLDLVNKERSANNLKPLNWNEDLVKSASDKLDDMFANQYFDHISKDGTTAWKFVLAEGYDYKYAGENLGIDYRNVDEVFDAWKKSPTHYENIMSDKFNEYGFAQKEGVYEGTNTIMFVQIFASK
jgi:uncharacterized protein YkwD